MRKHYALDLLFFHRGLNCLVAIEMKVGRFEPEYLGKLEALLVRIHELPLGSPTFC
ncbi:PDDEXK nuclease domain-containing protein [Variovorax paradoxus]|uniref:PDDEXK nuclease domain-containing protein n=1 Tax=Variovorax paradoxus TaxID=34073 RepID=UPI0022A82639|nr:PDDEXK nuclease domain-containing protein [Variovorax paradoxus]